MNIKQFIPPVFTGLFTRLVRNKKGKYLIGKYEIEIPPNFALPNFQKSTKLYDRFLPVLAKYLKGNKLIIDIGANIGDTTIAMIQQCDNPFICIEPSDIYFPYLENNLKKLTPTDFARVKTIKKLAGTGALSGELDHTVGGTATLKVAEDANAATHIPLDKLIEDSTNVLLLKVDTDGFDFDVLQSAEKILSDSEPVLFWENEITADFQYKGFEELYALLTVKGYKYIYIFDNFGNLMIETNDFESLKDINTYVYSMIKYGCTRTIFYTDILAATDKNQLIVKDAIAEYKAEWISK